ncbi:acyltransferase family protein [Nonomuraea sp. NPDC050404]|uniref:acyltransferase family protein n=1 Tax=Nonomuraea sp. NPDC050404 TaxID=3155783 RepID=UPI0033CCDFAB
MRRELLVAGAVTVGIAGQWLLTTYVVTDDLHVASPLTALPQWAPVTLLLQTVPVLFFASGYAHGGQARPAASHSAASRPAASRPAASWLPAFLLAWGVGLAVLAVNGFSLAAVRRILGPALEPLWFVLPYLLLTAVAPWLRQVVLRYGWKAALVPGVCVVLVDLVRFTWPQFAWLGAGNAILAWAVPFLLGLAWRQGGVNGAWLLGGGGILAAALTAFGPYPVSMVNVPGAPMSNLAPPTVALLAFACAQCGLVALLANVRPGRRAVASKIVSDRPGGSRLAVAISGAAVPLYLWHQTALALVSLVTVRFGPIAGLTSPPVGPAWPVSRLAWLPLCAVTLIALVALARPRERRLRSPKP